jgi:pyruvate-formate lyase
MEDSATGKRENPDQIPQENDTMGKTGKVISEQAGVQGQRKEVNVESYSKVANLGQILKDMNFPADKNKIIAFAKQQQQTLAANNKNIENKEEVISALQNLEDREYKNVSDVTTALGLVYQS